MKVKTRTVVVLTVNKPNTMHKRGRRAVAAWLRKRADELEQYGPSLGKTLRARYLC